MSLPTTVFCFNQYINSISGIAQSISIRAQPLMIGLPKEASNKLWFATNNPVAAPEPRYELQRELRASKLIGETRDSNKIYLYRCQPGDRVMDEIGRLREIAFRLVGEGTGKSRDIDDYDYIYDHIVLWDEKVGKIAGAYRVANANLLLSKGGISALYTSELFRYQQTALDYLKRGIELGRSFVNPEYWGKPSLDYLWQGIGAYINQAPNIRYVFGAVSITNDYPKRLKDILIYYYQTFYRHEKNIAFPNNPYVIQPDTNANLKTLFSEVNTKQGLEIVQTEFKTANCKIPILYKQYSSCFEYGGYRLVCFNIDPNFNQCIDGLFIADMNYMKPPKRKRYLKR